MPEVVRAVWPHDCPDTCSRIVTVEDGRATRMSGDAEHPVTRGFLCTKVQKYLERTYHDGRLLYPQTRTGTKGEGKFRRATWDEALDLIAAKLRVTVDAHGAESILPYSYARTMGLIQGEGMDCRFFHLLGATLLDRTICASAGTEALNVTYDTRIGPDPEDIAGAKLILLWGTNTLTANPHLWPFVREAKGNGTTTICIDPMRTRTAAACDEHIPIRPGTDAALALSMIHVLFRDGLEDRAYLEIHADDAHPRDIAYGARVSIFNDRGTFTAEAVIADRVRRGVVSAPSVWWPKLTGDGNNANHTTSQAVTDIGGGATFYDNQVEVRPA